ncbi:MAG: BrnT family toxin [Elusimicrobiota bacterium]
MGHYRWDPQKNERLKAQRGISFERIVLHIERGDVLGVHDHPNPARYPNQRIFVVNVDGYAYLVPFVDSEQGVFLKTIIPSRKATRDLLGGPHEEDQTR